MPLWVKGFNPELISQRMEKVKTVSSDGAVSFSGFDSLEHVVLLNSMIQFTNEIPEIEKQNIIRQATFKAGAKGQITPQSILAEISRLERAYLSTPEQKFKMLTEISVSRWCQFPKVYFEGSCIVVHASLNKASIICRNKLMVDAKPSITSDIPKDYAAVSVSVVARSTSEAAEKALNRLDFVRGVWNLWNNSRHSIRVSAGKRSPVNSILLAPIHTLHHRDGTLATKAWWWEPQYQGPIKLYNEPKKNKSMFLYMADFRRHLKKTNYAPDLVHAVVRYVRALDVRDWDNSFLRLWGVLEFLTGTLFDSYKVTIRRASYIYSDREYAHEVLSHLREFRNKSIHAGSESNDIEALMYQVKGYVEGLLMFHVGSKGRFSSIADAAEFLDSPGDKGLIDMKISKLRYAKKFIS